MFDTGLEACPECGWTPPAMDRDRPVDGTGELAEFNEVDFAYRRQIWNLIEAEREAMNYKNGWSLYRYQERFGVMPVLAGRELVDPDNATIDEKKAVFMSLSDVANRKGFKRGWASWRYKDIFGCWPRGFVNEVRAEAIRERCSKE
jgi:hypothetical protein